MSKTNYQHFRPNRLNPQFVGIADQYAQHKKARLEAQKNKQALSSNLKYTLKLDQTLAKSLQDKARELQRLKEIRQRHNQDVQKKLREEQNKRLHLQELRIKKTQERLKMQKNIKDALHSTIIYRRKLKKQVDNQFKELSEQYYSVQQEEYQQKYNMYKTIKQNHQFGHQNIDKFYRKKNAESLNHYKHMIGMQNKKKSFYEQQIHKMSETMNIFNRKISKKKNKLAKLQEQIDYYRQDPFSESKKSERINSSQVSYRSKRPSQILLSESQQLSSLKSKQKKISNPEVELYDV